MGKGFLDLILTPKRNIRKFELASRDSISFHKLIANEIPVNGGKKIWCKTRFFLNLSFWK